MPSAFGTQGQYIKVTEATLTYVAIDDNGKPRKFRRFEGSRLGRAQSWRLTPRVSSFLAYESLRFAAFAAVSVAA